MADLIGGGPDLNTNMDNDLQQAVNYAPTTGGYTRPPIVHDVPPQAQGFQGPVFNFEPKSLRIPPGLAHHRIVIKQVTSSNANSPIYHYCKSLNTISVGDLFATTKNINDLHEITDDKLYSLPQFYVEESLGLDDTQPCLTYYYDFSIGSDGDDYWYELESASDYSGHCNVNPYIEEFNESDVYYDDDSNNYDEIIYGKLVKYNNTNTNVTPRSGFMYGADTFKKSKAWVGKSYIPEEYQ